jgi:hypothetical protein
VVKLAGGIELLTQLNNAQDDDESDAAQFASVDVELWLFVVYEMRRKKAYPAG